jgi:hypothetical protein
VETNLLQEIEDLGLLLKKELDIPIAETPLNTDQSKFFKTVYQNTARTSNKLIERS